MYIKKLKIMEIRRKNEIEDVNDQCEIIVKFKKNYDNYNAYIEILYRNPHITESEYEYKKDKILSFSRLHDNKIIIYYFSCVTFSFKKAKNYENDVMNKLYEFIEKESEYYIDSLKDFKSVLNIKNRLEKFKRLLNEKS